MASTVSAQLAALTEAVSHLSKRAEEDREDRKEYHDELSKALTEDRKSSEAYRSAVQKDLAALTRGQQDLLNRVERIEPVTNMITSLRMRITGGLVVLGFIGAVVWGGITFFKVQILHWLGA